MARIAPRQVRMLKGQQPPMAVALTYRNLIWTILDRLNDQILKSILADWEKNPAHSSGMIRGDAIQSSFVTQKIGDLDVAVEELIDPAEVDRIGYVAERVNTHGKAEFARVVGIKTHDIGIGGTLNAFRDRNVDLIKSLAKSQMGDIRDVLTQAEAGAWHVSALRKEIQGRFGVTKSKADLLARDQTLKLNGQLTQTRQKNAGVKQYIWTTSRDERVRPMHEELDGTIQDWEQAPVVSPDGRRCHPGDDYQCRCTAYPVLEELDEELDPAFAPDDQPEEVLGYHPGDKSVSIFDRPAPSQPEPLPRGPGSLHKADLPDEDRLASFNIGNGSQRRLGSLVTPPIGSDPLRGIEFPKARVDPLPIEHRPPLRLPPEPQPVTVFQPKGPTVNIGSWPSTGSKVTAPSSQALGIKPDLEVPKDVRRSGFADAYQKVSKGVGDLDLDYMRDPGSFRSLEPFNRNYEALMGQGMTPTEIALKEPHPIKIDLEPDGKMHLRDGRHRWTTARKYGATQIEATVTQYGPKGGIRWQKRMVIPIKGP